MSVDTSHAAVGQHVPVSSPSFEGQGDLCLSFDYKVWVSRLGLVNTPPPRLEVYIRISRHVYSGWKLWASNGTGEGHAQLSVWAQAQWTYWISFVGVVGHPETTLISVANIRLNQDNCINPDCTQNLCGVNQDNSLNCKSSKTVYKYICEMKKMICYQLLKRVVTCRSWVTVLYIARNVNIMSCIT